MLKRIGVGLLVVLVLVASTFSAVSADEPEPPEGAPGLGRRRAPAVFLQLKAVLGKVADVLQLTGAELREALSSGQTFAEIAEGEDVPLDDVTDAVMADIEARLEKFFVEGFPARPGRPRLHQARGLALDVIAETLGMEEEVVAEALRDGETTVADLAEEAGVPLDDVLDALLAEAEEHLAEAVADGKLTQDEADEKLADLEEHLDQLLTEPLPAPRDRMQQKARILALDVVAETLGMEEEAVAEALRGGESVADLAEEAGVPLDDVVDALLAEAEERLAEAVEDGRLTQDEADEKLEQLEERVREHLETSPQDRRPPMPMRRGGRGGEWFGPRF
jgi:prolyl-tRNA editing enzyme YbaK/EbsC (Cys-tRNA(Pro) deacylase)